MPQASPSETVWVVRFAPIILAHCGSHFNKIAEPAGMDIWAVLRLSPEGSALIGTMSTGIVGVLTRPVPLLHSPKATVFVDPSVMSRRPNVAPAYWKTPLGGPLVFVP